jgi:hypothetical protein
MDFDDVWYNAWQATGLISVLTGLVLFVIIAFAPKNVDYYYLSKSGSGTATSCVYAHWTWHTDEVAYCTDDKDKALDFVSKANASMVKK